MNRTGLVAAIVVMFASSSAYAQFGGVGGMGGGGGRGGGTVGMGGGMGGMMGGMGGMMGQGNRPAAAFSEIERPAQVEMEGGQLLNGKIELRPLIVDGDLGQYSITPEKIKMIRFLKPAGDANAVDESNRNNNGEFGGGPEQLVARKATTKRAALMQAARAAGGLEMVGDPYSHTGMAVLTRGKVITTTGKEIIGVIHIPSDFKLDLDFGALTLAPVKLRSITFTGDDRKDKPVKAEAAAIAGKDAARPAPPGDPSPPRYMRHDDLVIVIAPIGDRVTLFNLDTKKSDSLELSGSKEAPLEVTPILGENLVALMLKGSKVTRIAVANTASGVWHSQALRKPLDGQATPIVGSGVVVYKLGQDIYAYGVESERWDVAQLPDGLQANPTVGPGTVNIESDGHIYTFTGKTGKWDHLDVRAILDHAGSQKK